MMDLHVVMDRSCFTMACSSHQVQGIGVLYKLVNQLVIVYLMNYLGMYHIIALAFQARPSDPHQSVTTMAMQLAHHSSSSP